MTITTLAPVRELDDLSLAAQASHDAILATTLRRVFATPEEAMELAAWQTDMIARGALSAFAGRR